MGLDFYVDENVLIPQPDTEILVEESIKLINKKQTVEVLDLCTGSGAIAVSIGHYCRQAKVIATDISKSAITDEHIIDKNICRIIKRHIIAIFAF